MSLSKLAASWIELEEEVQFGDLDVFFSRTDAHGRICSGNEVFERISGFEWRELLGAPHKIVRHPDTPHATFHVLWREILAGRPVGAYVKNRAKTGRHYWVFAIVSPIEDGFLSVRLKPASELFDQARDLYSQILSQRSGSTPAESFERLEASLTSLGYGSYRTFMSQALGRELLGRETRLRRRASAGLKALVDLQALAIGNITLTRDMQAACQISRHLPLSLQVQAARLGPTAIAVTTIASNYRAIVEELAGSVAEFSAAALSVEQAVSDALFLHGAAQLQGEMAARFRQEPPKMSDQEDLARLDLPLLDRLTAMYRAKARDGMSLIAPSIARFEDACADMKRLAAGLEVTRIVGKMESARLLGKSDGLESLLQELGVFQQSISAGLTTLSRQSAGIANGLREASDAIRS